MAERLTEDPRADAAPSLTAAHIGKRYGKKEVLRDVSLAVHTGEAVALVGENGAGKTTLLRICGGLHSDGGEACIPVQRHVPKG